MGRPSRRPRYYLLQPADRRGSDGPAPGAALHRGAGRPTLRSAEPGRQDKKRKGQKNRTLFTPPSSGYAHAAVRQRSEWEGLPGPQRARCQERDSLNRAWDEQELLRYLREPGTAEHSETERSWNQAQVSGAGWTSRTNRQTTGAQHRALGDLRSSS
ncbi:hypothetical protein EYF80_061019 [Liparis tanakae]|uniref:Uncharacterized protein n=1 Tax=Liparis tanakae TaxID=230148 RepID=A0A4Z2EJ32_9TELE|nr:hypothetical protein EYF80_061019 [Liparis tanakae]